MQYKLIPLIIGQVFIKADGSSYHTKSFSFLNLTVTCLPFLLVSRVDLFLYVNKSDMKCTTDVDSNEICLFEPCSETRLTSSVLEVGLPWTFLFKMFILWIILVFLIQKVKV